MTTGQRRVDDADLWRAGKSQSPTEANLATPDLACAINVSDTLDTTASTGRPYDKHLCWTRCRSAPLSSAMPALDTHLGEVLVGSMSNGAAVVLSRSVLYRQSGKVLIGSMCVLGGWRASCGRLDLGLDRALVCLSRLVPCHTSPSCSAICANSKFRTVYVLPSCSLGQKHQEGCQVKTRSTLVLDCVFVLDGKLEPSVPHRRQRRCRSRASERRANQHRDRKTSRMIAQGVRSDQGMRSHVQL